MSYLVDSDWLADYPKGSVSARTFLDSLITYAEIYQGIYYGAERRRHEEGFRALLRAVPVLSLSRPIARRPPSTMGNVIEPVFQQAGRLMWRYAQSRGKLLHAGIVDIGIDDYPYFDCDLLGWMVVPVGVTHKGIPTRRQDESKRLILGDMGSGDRMEMSTPPGLWPT